MRTMEDNISIIIIEKYSIPSFTIGRVSITLTIIDVEFTFPEISSIVNVIS